MGMHEKKAGGGRGGGEGPKYVQRMKTKFYQELHPAWAGDVVQGLKERLELLLMRFNERYGGVIMSFSDTRILGRCAQIVPGLNPYLRFQVSAVVEVFSPAVGHVLEGKVNNLGHDHIGVLILDHFKASIRYDFIKQDLRYEEETNCWMSMDAEEHRIAVGDEIRFVAESVQVDGDFLDIAGSLLPDGTGSKTWLESLSKGGGGDGHGPMLPIFYLSSDEDKEKKRKEGKQKRKEEKRMRKEERRRQKDEKLKSTAPPPSGREFSFSPVLQSVSLGVNGKGVQFMELSRRGGESSEQLVVDERDVQAHHKGGAQRAKVARRNGDTSVGSMERFVDSGQDQEQVETVKVLSSPVADGDETNFDMLHASGKSKKKKRRMHGHLEGMVRFGAPPKWIDGDGNSHSENGEESAKKMKEKKKKHKEELDGVVVPGELSSHHEDDGDRREYGEGGPLSSGKKKKRKRGEEVDDLEEKGEERKKKKHL